MRLTCPCCGATLSLEALLNDAAARQAVASALALPAGLDARLLRYLGLFRPPQRSLTWDRAARLLEELNTMISAGQIQRHGRAWPAPVEYWQRALDEITNRQLDLPLKSHGYLLEIIAGLGNKAEAQAEADIEARRRRSRPADSDVEALPDIGPVDTTAGEILPPEPPPAPRQSSPRRMVMNNEFLRFRRAAGLPDLPSSSEDRDADIP